MRALFWGPSYLGLFALCLGQNQEISLRRIERWYELGLYERIISKAQQNRSSFQSEKLFYLASAYYRTGNKEAALNTYRQAFGGMPGGSAVFHLEYARLLHEEGDLTKAHQQYQVALEKGADAQEVSLYLSYIQKALQATTDTTYQIERLDLGCSEGPTYAAYLAGGELYYIHRCRRPGCKIYPTDGYPYEQIGARPLPTRYRYHQGVVGFRPPDTLLLYLSRGKGGIYYAVRTSTPEGWSRPRRWPVLPRHPKGQYSFCEDPLTGDLYFVSDHGGKSTTGRDMYRLRAIGQGRYSSPEKLPAPLNTPYDEDAPFIVGDTLYFASRRPESIGGYDIFYAVRQGERDWSAPRSMPMPVNSIADDIYYYPFSPEETYFASGREGRLQVYRVKRKKPSPLPLPPLAKEDSMPAPPPAPRVLVLAGRVYDSRTQAGIPAQVILVDSATQKELIAAYAQADGSYRLYPPRGGRFYVYVQAPGYITYVQVISLPPTPPEEPVQLSVPLFPIEMEATFQLRNIYFDFNSDKLRPESIPELERLLRLLQQNPNIRIRFSGHTDNIGGDKYNQALSERRARAVYEWLRQHGIHPIQMEYIGYGKTRPIASNATEEGRSLNRRIEMEVVGIRKANGQAALEGPSR